MYQGTIGQDGLAAVAPQYAIALPNRATLANSNTVPSVVQEAQEAAGFGTSGIPTTIAKVWCTRCQINSHLTKDCSMPHYYVACDKDNHDS
jgi:hypothetical protein